MNIRGEKNGRRGEEGNRSSMVQRATKVGERGRERVDHRRKGMEPKKKDGGERVQMSANFCQFIHPHVCNHACENCNSHSGATMPTTVRGGVLLRLRGLCFLINQWSGRAGGRDTITKKQRVFKRQ